MPPVDIQDVRSFWEQNPLCASGIPHPLGSTEYFEAYDALREASETPELSSRLHEYTAFRGKRVLDVGSGNGYVLSRYARAGAEVFGIDLTKVGVDLCRQRFAWLRLPGTFLLGDAERLPFRDARFDCVCSMGVLHHTPDLEAALGEIRRVLKPGGRLIMMLYHRDSVLYRVRFPVMRLFTGKPLAQLVNEVDGVGNPKAGVFSKAEVRLLLARFEKLELFVGLLQRWMFPPGLGRFVPAGLLRSLESRLGWFLYAKVVRPAA